MAALSRKTKFVCAKCGNETPKWEGQCRSCGEWNTLSEVRFDRYRDDSRSWSGLSADTQIQELYDVTLEDSPRISLKSKEFNRVLGGGIVRGSMIVLAGDPGIGKSTLLLQTAADVASTLGGALYVSGEESIGQIRIRSDRLGISGKDVYLLQATNLGTVMSYLQGNKPGIVVIDSIQTIYNESMESSAGSPAQIRECTRIFMEWAKAQNTPMILTGHVTKGGDIAGPRLLEHMVDVVLHIEGDPISSWRLLRAVKNRFGSTNDTGVFEMLEKGLIDVEDPSHAFLLERAQDSVGSVIVANMEGTRPILTEVQALTSRSVLSNPRRVSTGIDFNRLLLICAVITKRAHLNLANEDVVVNVTGGLRLAEPAADLGVALAIVSSVRDVSMPPGLVALGEIGLSGEIRSVPHLERRVSEVARLGFNECLIPRTLTDQINVVDGLVPRPVGTISEAIKLIIP